MLENYKIQQVLDACQPYNPIFNFAVNSMTTISNITLDSRLAKTGDIFIALAVGSKYNPQDYIADLTAQGIICITSKDYPLTNNVVLVDDVILSLGAIAQDYKTHIVDLKKQQQDNLLTIVVTGSNGKTTLKNMLTNIFICAYGEEYICSTIGNLNNQLGVPQTLLSLQLQHKVLIVELGMNQKGEIDYLSSLVKPEIAVINNYHHAHIGNFNNISDIIEAKNEVLNHVTTTIFINSHDNYYQQSYQYINIKNNKLKLIVVDTSIASKEVKRLGIHLQLLGHHNYANAFTAIQVAHNVNISFQHIKQGLESYRGFPSRLELLPIQDSALIIDDSYNANLDSTLAALNVLQDFNNEQLQWVVLADLKELGDYSQKHHELIADKLNNMQIDLLLTVGVATRFTSSKFNGNKEHFNNNQQLLSYLKRTINKNLIILFKGSRIMNLRAEVINHLLEDKYIL